MGSTAGWQVAVQGERCDVLWIKSLHKNTMLSYLNAQQGAGLHTCIPRRPNQRKVSAYSEATPSSDMQITYRDIAWAVGVPGDIMHGALAMQVHAIYHSMPEPSGQAHFTHSWLSTRIKTDREKRWFRAVKTAIGQLESGSLMPVQGMGLCHGSCAHRLQRSVLPASRACQAHMGYLYVVGRSLQAGNVDEGCQ